MNQRRHFTTAQLVVAACLVLLLLILATQVEIPPVGPIKLEDGARIAAISGVAIGLASLVVTAISTAASWRRQKRQATIESWTDWSESTAVARKCLTKHLGPKQITIEQAEGLIARDGQLTDQAGRVLTETERAEVKDSVTVVLNGLERIANGVRLGVYDAATLRQLGATIVVRNYERLQPYIELRRQTSNLELRQNRAYIALDYLVTHIKRQDLDAERLGHLRAKA